MKENKNEYRSPRRVDRGEYRITPPMMAETYDECLREEMEETLAAVIMSETYPDSLDYEKTDVEEKWYGEE